MRCLWLALVAAQLRSCDGLHGLRLPRRLTVARPHLRCSPVFVAAEPPEDVNKVAADSGKAADVEQDAAIIKLQQQQEQQQQQRSQTEPIAEGNSRMRPMQDFPSTPEESFYMKNYGLMEDLTRPYWRRQTKVEYVRSWPVGDWRSNPEIGGRTGLRSIQWFRGLRDDFRRKAPLYRSDWTDGLQAGGKSFAAISFLYFACLAPVVAFGGAMAGLTQGAMGVAEVIASCGLCGMLYSMISGQPMTFVAPTGLTLA